MNYFKIDCKGAVRSNLTPLFLREDLINFGLKEDKADEVSSLWKQKFTSISRSAIGQTLMVNQLVDMDWKFGVTASTSDLAKSGTSFLQLKLVLDKG